MWLVVFVVAHLLTIAVIRGDQTFTTRSKQCRFDAAQALIKGFHRRHCGIKLTGVAHHVTVGKVDDDKVVVTRLDGRDQRIGNLMSAHLRLQVIGGNVG